ncbi:hypothetical protein [Paenibacillus sp. NEAU-GSW1]|uniref:hypothetical protein n=1 Tax=Paenibacillus sp. NEAU-GSW1 TaxID=2682486 RepID=UPI0012E2CD69|nr:hypothetical protein [Paenibacillus sp. NEAU-GSW1]MUT67052.1 hypothetical protein [Paenibacillus sp. NEAU-GSW1]
MKKATMITGSLIIAIVLAIIVGVIGADKVQACSCEANPGPKAMLKFQDVVFAGKAVAVKSKSNIPLLASSDVPVRVDFQVSEIWKGAVDADTAVFTASNDSCGVDFKPGTDYLVYGNMENGKLRVNLCGGTKKLNAASADLLVLGKGTAPSGPYREDGALTRWMPLLITAAALTLFLFFIGYARKRRRTFK